MTAPMRVVSGPAGREQVHSEAPVAAGLEDEMRGLLRWFNGNGRIARAIADMALARSEGSSQRFYRMSAQIRHERAEYYCIIEQTQRGTMDVTPWMACFLGNLTPAPLSAGPRIT